jgi:hypothetical protein
MSSGSEGLAALLAASCRRSGQQLVCSKISEHTDMETESVSDNVGGHWRQRCVVMRRESGGGKDFTIRSLGGADAAELPQAVKPKPERTWGSLAPVRLLRSCGLTNALSPGLLSSVAVVTPTL